MTREQLIKHWDVIKAFKEGKEIQYKDIFTKEFEDIDEPYFKLNVEYRIKPTPQKRLPTIKEVERWFLENRVFCKKNTSLYLRIKEFDKNGEFGTSLLIWEDQWMNIERFCEDFTHYNGSELYITE